MKDKTSLHTKLQKAVELELATIPPYLTAVFSIHPDANRDAATIIRSVYMEEMLHLVLAANILSATGGTVKLGKDNMPTYPLAMEFKDGVRFKGREFDIDLARFSKPTIDTFRKIELPTDQLKPDAALKAEPFEVEGRTIGEFYESIKKELEDLCNTPDDKEVFSGNPDHQINQSYYWSGGGKPIVVTDLHSAFEAIEEIVEQGEGADSSLLDEDEEFGEPDEYAHYFRFNEIYHCQRYSPKDKRSDDPSGKPLGIDYDAVYPIKANCKRADFKDDPELTALNDQFNYAYSLMLAQLEEGFRGNPKVFYTAIMNGMHALLPIAFKMVQLPIKGNAHNEHGSPSFEWVDPI